MDDDSNHNEEGMDMKTVLTTLEQVGETLQVLTSIVERLETYVHKHIESEDPQQKQFHFSISDEIH